MRNYIIINGQSSAEIEGLIIERLAPISKPQQRTNVITVDGRDGDIITPLGYSAYDKSITIGLSYNYDVDQVIEYFNQSGTIIFSNEPDKYYKFAIYEQIDLERLIRFKRAIVTLHVQPFKYSAIETAKTFSFTSGGTATIVNSGNTTSKPKLVITGTGTVTVNLNGSQILTINMTSPTITIDAEAMEAYAQDNTLANRSVQGNYNSLQLNPRSNTLTFGGDVTNVTITNYSRWI
jgi:predicted phage tail component-like protein